MRIHYYKYITLFASLLTFTGCSNEADIAISNADKHPIAFTVGADAPATRAVISDGTDKTLEAFDAATDIWMVMQSDYKALDDNDLNYKGSQTTTNCVTMGTTGAKTASNKENVVNFTADNTRYWDDAHARSSALSIWAVAVPGVTGDGAKWGSKTACSWTTTIDADKTIAWEVPAAQNAESMKNKDLCFSNNIVDYTSASGTDNRMKYGTTTQYKFDKGKLIFYHALTKITIKLVEGDGFDTSSDVDFNLDNITLKGFKLSGTFNVAQGEFSSQATSATSVTSMSQAERTASDMTLEALVMPGAKLGGTSEAVSLSLDGNAFSISSETLAASLRTALGVAENATIPALEAGKNYVFQFTVSKTGITVVATIAAWDKVEGTNYSPLINITEVYGQERTEQNNFAKDFSFYLSESKGDSYTKGTDVTYNSSDKSYSLDTPLYWPNHSTHYFFRGIWPKVAASGTNVTPSDKVSASAITVENKAYSSGTYPSDLMLALPRDTESKTCPHGKKVLEEGICATEGEVRMNFQYVMSWVEVNLSTNNGGTNAVVLDSETKVEIIGCYKDGSILLGDGSASLTTKADYPMSFSKFDSEKTIVTFQDAIIPQALENEIDALKFCVTVKDGATLDSYETVLGIKDIEVGGSTIDKWEPGKHYVYNLYITKTGITVVATIKDWEKTTGSTTIWM